MIDFTTSSVLGGGQALKGLKSFSLLSEVSTTGAKVKNFRSELNLLDPESVLNYQKQLRSTVDNFQKSLDQFNLNWNNIKSNGYYKFGNSNSTSAVEKVTQSKLKNE